MTWLQKFLIFLLVIIVLITLGVTVMYLMKNNETAKLSSYTMYVNKGESFSVTVIHEHAHKGTTIKLISANTAVVIDGANKDNIYTFSAKNGGKAIIKLQSNNASLEQECVVYVGDGSKENPYFIRNYDDLISIGGTNNGATYFASSYYKQIQDIDLSIKNANRWTPICYNSESGFTGDYDGNGHTIYNLKIMTQNNVDEAGFPKEKVEFSNAGLFAKIGVSGIVESVNLQQVNINENECTNIGCIAGYNMGTIRYCNVIGATLQSTSANIGGVAGVNIKGQNETASALLDRVSFVGDIKVTQNAGGITYKNHGGQIVNCYTKGIFAPQNGDVTMGGIVCDNRSHIINSTICKANIYNSYSTMSVITVKAENDDTELFISNKMGMIAYSNINPSGNNILNNVAGENRLFGNYYYTTQNFKGIYNQNDNGSMYFVTSSSLDQLKTIPTKDQINEIIASDTKLFSYAFITYGSSNKETKWDFNRVWKIISTENDGLPTLRPIKDSIAVGLPVYDVEVGTYIEIDEEQDLIDLTNGVYGFTGNFLMTQNIVMTTNNFIPIGTKDNPFKGHFIVETNGEEYYQISNLKIDPSKEYVGLFGYIADDAEIRGVTLINVQITGGSKYVGAIAGYNQGKVIDCRVVNGSITLNTNNIVVGGLVGQNENSIYTDLDAVQKSNIDIKITCDDKAEIYAGGIVGINKKQIKEMSCSGNINITYSAQESSVLVGGVCGYNIKTIERCLSQCNIDTSNTEGGYVGGIVGKTECGQVTMSGFVGTLKGSEVGGVAGYVIGETNESVIIGQCYVGDNASTTQISGCLVGGLASKFERGIIENCYTRAYLSGETMAGLSVSVPKSAKVQYCYSTATFNNDAGTAYYETRSEVRKYHDSISLIIGVHSSDKKAGCVDDCIINTTGRDAKFQDKDTLDLWNTLGSDYGNRSDEDCKKTSTYSDRGFKFGENNPWKCDSDYPVLIKAKYS